MSDQDQTALAEELIELANSMCDRTITDQQRQRLEQMLSDHPALRPVYLDYLRVHAGLVWRYRTGDVASGSKPGEHSEKPSSVVSSSKEDLKTPESDWGTNLFARWAFVAAISASLMAAVLIWQRGFQTSSSNDLVADSQTPVYLFVATLRDATSAVWSNDGRPVDVGSRVEIGELRLDAGEAELVFDSGAKLMLAGPVELQLESPFSVYVKHGRVAAHMPETAVGFELHTPTSTLVDQGTEFGVAVDQSGSTQVHVFKGQVDLHYAKSESKELTEKLAMVDGHARRIDTPGTAGEEITFSKSDFGNIGRLVSEPLQWKVSDGGNGHYYQVIVERSPIGWHQAARKSMNKFFRGMPGHLASVTSAEEDKFIVEILNRENINTRGVWMGLTDILREGHFRWVTGEQYDYSNWASWPEQQPDNFREADWHGGEDYGMYTRFPDKQPWAWNDLSIDSMHEKVSAYIVEYEPTVDALRHHSMALDPIHWKPEDGGNGHYYRVVLTMKPTDWQTIRELAADSELLGTNGHLVALETAEERKFIAEDILRICGIPEMMIGLSGSLEEGKLQWVNGESVDGIEVERSHLPTDEIYGVFHWNPAGNWQTGWEIRAMSMDIRPAGWFGYLIEYPVENSTE